MKDRVALPRNEGGLSKFDLFVFWFVVVDNLFFPYFWGITVSYSFPFVFIWYCIRLIQSKIKISKSYRQIIFFAGISTLLGCLIYPKYVSDDIVLYLNLLLVLFSFQMFIHVRQQTTESIIPNVHKVLCVFVIFVFFFALLFYSDFDTYERIRHFFCPRLVDSTVDILSGTIRFGYYWSDENNIAYMICGVVLLLLYSDYINFIMKNVLVVIAIVIVVATMSTGGIASLAFTIFVYVTFLLFDKKGGSNPIFKILILIIIAGIFIYGLVMLFSSDVYQLMEKRFEGKTDGSDSRSSIYIIVLKTVDWWKYILWGYGGRTIVGGISRSTHNGVLHMIIAFGMIVCYYYIKLYFFKKKCQSLKDWIWRVPVLIGFMINIMITEDKIHVLMFLLLAFETKYRKKKDEKQFVRKYNYDNSLYKPLCGY